MVLMFPVATVSFNFLIFQCNMQLSIIPWNSFVWLCEVDISTAFKDFWCNFLYVLERNFLLCSLPHFQLSKIFDSLSEAPCWILNDYKFPYVTYPLDDFLIVTSSSSPCYRLSAVIKAFSELGDPLSQEKMISPSMSLEFLGITLNFSPL